MRYKITYSLLSGNNAEIMSSLTAEGNAGLLNDTCLTNYDYLDKEIASMLIMGFEGTNLHEEEVKKVSSYLDHDMLGGVILFARNIESPQQLKMLTDKFIDSKKDAFIAVDQEGGRVQRLTPTKGFKAFPSASSIAKLSTIEAKDIYSKLSLELNDHGINLNFAPVVDINNSSNPCPVIGSLERSFGEDSEKIIEYASICIDAHHENKIFTAIKHFPGHGLASSDSHLGLVDVTSTAKPEELIPFYKLIESRKVDMIMTAHIINKHLDPLHPATLSPFILKELLFKKGYDGVIVSDDLHMGAIASHYSFKDSVVMAINAGCNLLIFSNNPLACKNIMEFKPDHDIPLKFIRVVKEAIKEGEIDIEKIHTSYNKINSLKAKFA